MLEDEELIALARRLVEVPGVVAVALGGSRARGEHTPASDVDLGLYYHPPLDCDALGELARAVAGPRARVTRPGEWGPWVDGGGWLMVSGTAVDWLYRNVDRVRHSCAKAQEGDHVWHSQTGHPLGVPDFLYAGELALGRILADPSEELTALRARMLHFPPRLRAALRRGVWEAQFTVSIARKAAARGDTTYIAGCLFRALELCAYALHGHAGRWLVNEKGAIASAGRLRCSPPEFAVRCHAVLGRLGTDDCSLRQAIDDAEVIVAETAEVCQDDVADRP